MLNEAEVLKYLTYSFNSSINHIFWHLGNNKFSDNFAKIKKFYLNNLKLTDQIGTKTLKTNYFIYKYF